MINTKALVQEIENKKYDMQLIEVYVDHSKLDQQRERYIQAIEQFELYFGEAEVEIYSTPGRSEVCGNHTDHQHGMVLATSINLDSIAVVTPNNTGIIRIKSENYDLFEVDCKQLQYSEAEKGTSKSLVKGVLEALSKDGYIIGGFTMYTTSDVLIGAGLSSSAAFEVLIGTVISGLYNGGKIDAVKLAQVAQYAENVYFGKPCGLMDQMACSVGNLINIDFKEANQPVVRKLDVDFEQYDYSLCIVDTKGSHADLTEEYGFIPSEMKAVAEALSCSVLREVKEEEFLKNIPLLREQLGDRAVLRALHYYQEERHVEQAVKALQDSDFAEFLAVIKESGNSSYKYLQNVYSNQDIHHQNVSVALALSEQNLGDNGVCRVHGGGFAGTIQAFVKNEAVEGYKAFIELVFGEDSCHVLKVRKYGGIKVIG